VVGKTQDPAAQRVTASKAGCDGDSQVSNTSPTMLGLERIAADIASTDIPVLLVGESGTGKGVFALYIHRLSLRRDEPLVKMTCDSLSKQSLLAWLRETDRCLGTKGVVGAGTVLFDEVSELDAACQSSLLHALPDGEAAPKTQSLMARPIFTTSRDLEEEIRAGRFRRDFYYRINGFCLRLPPLRERREDIPALIDFFLSKYAAMFERPRPSLSPRTLQLLLEHPWPGNIRQLKNVIRKIVALGDEQIADADLTVPSMNPGPAHTDSQGLCLKTVARAASQVAERALILKTLTRTRWNRKRAAQELHISYKSLLYKLKLIGLEHPKAT
jgi:two-component system, NtrC family, response regulator AtoC